MSDAELARGLAIIGIGLGLFTLFILFWIIWKEFFEKPKKEVEEGK